jgi:hypothetical protein
MYAPVENAEPLAEEFRRQPYGPHSPALEAMLTWLRTRPRARKLVLHRGPGGLRLCELERDPVRLTPLAAGPFATLEDAERAAFDIRWQETTGQAGKAP